MQSDGQTISTFCHNIHFTSRDRRSTKIAGTVVTDRPLLSQLPFWDEDAKCQLLPTCVWCGAAPIYDTPRLKDAMKIAYISLLLAAAASSASGKPSLFLSLSCFSSCSLRMMFPSHIVDTRKLVTPLSHIILYCSCVLSLLCSLPVGQICGYPQKAEPLKFTQNLVYAYVVPTYAR